MNHKSIPSLSSSISSNTVENIQSTPRTSSSSNSSYYNHILYSPAIMPNNNTTPSLTHSNSLRSNYNDHSSIQLNSKRYSEPSPVVTKRWDDSQLEMELAEDDLIDKKKKVRRNSSLRLKQKFQLSAESYIIDKFRHHHRSSHSQEDAIVIVKQHKLSNSFKKVRDWLF